MYIIHWKNLIYFSEYEPLVAMFGGFKNGITNHWCNTNINPSLRAIFTGGGGGISARKVQAKELSILFWNGFITTLKQSMILIGCREHRGERISVCCTSSPIIMDANHLTALL